MKKFFAFGLMALLFLLASSMAPTTSVPVDNDVGICYVINADVSQPDLYSIEIPAIPVPSYQVCMIGDVEKFSDYNFTKVSTGNVANDPKMYKVEGLRHTRAEYFSQNRALFRHT